MNIEKKNWKIIKIPTIIKFSNCSSIRYFAQLAIPPTLIFGWRSKFGTTNILKIRNFEY